jgi:arylsulfatase A-like enzyme
VLKKAPWSWFLLAAILPIGLVTLYRFHDPLAICLHAGILALFLILGYFELKAASKVPLWILSLGVSGLLLIALIFITNPPLPGRSLVGKGPSKVRIPPTAEAPNLLLIVLDTMRSDHLEVYGYDRATSPWIQSFGQKVTIFNNAFSSSSYTLPAHATLFTGLYPRSHGADIFDGEGGISLAQLGRLNDEVPVAPLDSEALTLAEIAKEAGLDTGAICGNTAYLCRYFGLDQGFDTYVDKRPVREIWRPAGLSLGNRILTLLGRNRRLNRLLESNERFYLLASEVNALALKWLDSRRDRRFFLFLNYNDPHEPNLPFGKYKNLFPDADKSLIDAYDAEVRYMDSQLAALFDRLESWGLLDLTLVIIVGDHGESFWEHGKKGHAVTLYEPEVHIPLLLRLPAQQIGHRVDRFVHLVDVLPTILDLMGFKRPVGLEGDSLFGGESRFPIVSYLGKYYRDYDEWAIYRDPWKLILQSGGNVELYDIRKNPEETENISVQNPGLAEEMIADLKRFLDEVKPRFQRAKKNDMDKKIKELLRSLGYIK